MNERAPAESPDGCRRPSPRSPGHARPECGCFTRGSPIVVDGIVSLAGSNATPSMTTARPRGYRAQPSAASGNGAASIARQCAMRVAYSGLIFAATIVAKDRGGSWQRLPPCWSVASDRRPWKANGRDKTDDGRRGYADHGSPLLGAGDYLVTVARRCAVASITVGRANSPNHRHNPTRAEALFTNAERLDYPAPASPCPGEQNAGRPASRFGGGGCTLLEPIPTV